MNIEQVAIDQILPYPHNPRRNDDTVESIKRSLTEFGWQQPIVCDPQGVIVVGHTRWRAAKELGYSRVPVIYADLSDEQARAYRIMDNKAHDYTRWNRLDLRIELDDLMELDLTGFTLKELDDILYPELGLIGNDVKHTPNHHVIIECQNEGDLDRVAEIIKQQGYTDWKKNQY